MQGPDECWPISGRVRLPYGTAHIAGHKFSYLLHYGSYHRKMAVWQDCGTRNCVNPAHLSLRSPGDIRGDTLDDLWIKFHGSYEVDDKTGCWDWTGRINSNGYGTIGSAAKRLFREVLAHRVSLILHGTDLPKGMLACHKCDNRKCVNPEHLYVGTHSDNSRDMHDRNRAKPPFRDVSHCVRGHEFTAENTGRRADGSGRYCITCHREASRRNYMKRKARTAGLV